MPSNALRIAATAWCVALTGLISCAKDNAVAVDDPACPSGGCGGALGAGGQSVGGTLGNGGSAGGVTGGGAGSGGTVSPSAGGAGPGAGGAMSSDGGSSGGGVTSSSGGASGAGGGGSGGAVSIPMYTLVVDTPQDGASLHGTVTVSGHAPGFVNVEVWDGTHQHPPLAQATPAADGSFSVQIDTSALPAGATTWTVYAWDVPAGQPSTHDANVPLNLSIEGAPTPDAGTTTGTQTVGVGDIGSPAVGPAPTEGGKISGAKFVLVKNWDFGTSGTIRNVNDMISEFLFHDQFGTIANGTNYGAVIVAPNAGTAIAASGLGLPNNMQPVEDPTRPNREWTGTSLLAHVRPLTASQSTVTVSAHDAGNGSFVAKWKLSSGGALLGKDILWETRVRMPKPLAAYWFALWTAGNKWNKGAEMDVLESFGSSNIYPPPTAFHVNSVGGSDAIDYSSWPNGLTAAQIPTSDRDLTAYHTWTWLYKTDDTYVVYFDGYVAQTGTLHWTLGGGTGSENIDMDFLFDLGFGHTQIAAVNISLPASSFPLTYEVDYSRVYLR